MNAIEIMKLSRIERLQVMETLWDSLLDDDLEMETPEWHGNILEERKKMIESGSAEFISLDELKAYRNS